MRIAVHVVAGGLAVLALGFGGALARPEAGGAPGQGGGTSEQAGGTAGEAGESSGRAGGSSGRAGGPSGQEGTAPKSPAARGKSLVEAKVTASASAIDGCVDRYLAAHPGAKGAVRIAVLYNRDGATRAVQVDTALKEPKKLRDCLYGVARTWSLPPLARDDAKLELSIAVYPGAKFRLGGPKETADAKRQPAQEASGPPDDRPLGDFTFYPGQFLMGGWKDPGDGDGSQDPGAGAGLDEAAGEPPESNERPADTGRGELPRPGDEGDLEEDGS